MAIQGAKPRKKEEAQKQIDWTTKWIEAKRLPYPVLLDPQAAYYESLQLRSGPYPVLLLLDGKGRVAWVGSPGSKTFQGALSKQLKRLFASDEKPSVHDEPPR